MAGHRPGRDSAVVMARHTVTLENRHDIVVIGYRSNASVLDLFSRNRRARQLGGRLRQTIGHRHQHLGEVGGICTMHQRGRLRV